MWTQAQIDEYMARRTWPYEWKRVTYNADKYSTFQPKRGHAHGKDWVELRAGLCPCAICGHECMGECDEHDCQCCSSLCT